MIRSVRIDVGADTPAQAKELLDYCFERLGLPPVPENKIDEVYRRDRTFGGFEGRRKADFEVPMNAKEENEWRDGGSWPFDSSTADERGNPLLVTSLEPIPTGDGVHVEFNVQGHRTTVWAARGTTAVEASEIAAQQCGYDLNQPGVEWEMRDAQGHLLVHPDLTPAHEYLGPLQLHTRAGIGG